MRNYAKNIVRSTAKRQSRNFKESRDGIIWALDVDTREAQVRIQGTDEVVVCTWPENFSEKPPYLRFGGCVKIGHVGGNQNRMEITGYGSSIPTPQTGFDQPINPGDANAVITGLTVNVTNPLTMAVTVGNGTFRINDIQYTIAGMPMGDDEFVMGDYPDIEMGEFSSLVVIDPAPTYPNYRIDSIFIGANSVIDYVAGTPSTNPVAPDLPLDHIRLQDIIIPPGITEITSVLLTDWETPALHYIEFDFDVEELDYTDTTGAVGTVNFFDQYGALRYGQWTLEADFVVGNGTLVFEEGETWEVSSVDSKLVMVMPSTDNHITFKYYRHGTGDDVSPTIKVYMQHSQNMVSYDNIILWDALGTTPMY